MEVIERVVLLPGDELRNHLSEEELKKYPHGEGTAEHQNRTIATKAGVLKCQDIPPHNLCVSNMQRKYVAGMNDMVIGLITMKHTENYKVDIGGALPAILSTIAFEGATKRNRPNLQVGSLVYGRVIVANREAETELSCTSPQSRKGWASGESYFGPLVGGYLFQCSVYLARILLDPDCAVLEALGRAFPFEVAVGVNGRVWVNSANPLHTIVISNAILNSETFTRAEIEVMVHKLVSAVKQS
eukprot:GILK01004888.1.p1 GENE.GILK01004888.1~~GILK01004888.1.p1  ORF type:complete len:243 (-),score=21.17 GILK01004888.1:84-812(-)